MLCYACLPSFGEINIYTRNLRIGNFRSNRIMNRIDGYDLNSNRIWNRISVYSCLCVQCRLLQELCRPTAYYRELPYCMLRCNVNKNHKHKINLNYIGTTVEVFCWTISMVCDTMAGVADSSRKFWISPSLLNWIRIVRFEFESNIKALQVPNLTVKLRWTKCNFVFLLTYWSDSGKQASRWADEVYTTLHSLYQAERNETAARLGRQQVVC